LRSYNNDAMLTIQPAGGHYGELQRVRSITKESSSGAAITLQKTSHCPALCRWAQTDRYVVLSPGPCRKLGRFHRLVPSCGYQTSGRCRSEPDCSGSQVGVVPIRYIMDCHPDRARMRTDDFVEPHYVVSSPLASGDDSRCPFRGTIPSFHPHQIWTSSGQRTALESGNWVFSAVRLVLGVFDPAL
jgi:hypothetical protein